MDRKKLVTGLAMLTPEQMNNVLQTAENTLNRDKQLYEVPGELVNKVGKYILQQAKKHPDMSKRQIMDKAAKKFNLKPMINGKN